MKISLNWIKEFVPIPEKYKAKELAELLTLRTCEVENLENQGEKFRNTVVGRVLKIKPHPNASKLRLCDTDIGGTAIRIVCGGKNLKENMLVPVALPGAFVYWHGQSELAELKETEIRGEKSFGMICAGEEIGLPKCPAEEITDLSHLEVEPGTPLSHALRLNDVIFEIENKSITHRPDLWGHYGLAREFAAFLNLELKPYEKVFRAPQFPKKGEKTQIIIEDSRICERICSCIITGLKVEESPEWIKTKLLACGMRPVNNIVDVTNYIMLELGQPMHAFDRRAIENDTFVIKFAKEGEVFETIDHKERKLCKEDAIIGNGKKTLGIAGIMGGKESEITNATTEVVLEIATWNPIMIRKTAKRQGLRSESSQRFEKGLDSNLPYLAMTRACELLLKLCPNAKIAGEVTDVKNFPAKTSAAELSLSKMSKKIGVEISQKEAGQILKKLGFEITASAKDTLKIKIPSWRNGKDITIEDDLVEEIARMYGYEKIPAAIPDLPIKLPRENRERKLKHWARYILSFGLGFTETLHYSFYSRDALRKCLISEEPHLKIENPLSEDQTHLRVSLLPNILKSAPKKAEFKAYEIGRCYRKNPGSYFPSEEKFICGAVAKERSKFPVFYHAKGACEKFLEKFPSLPFCFEETKEPPPYAHPKKCADVIIAAGKRVRVGIIFELHPLIAKNFEIETEVGVFEINFSLLASLPLGEKIYAPLPKFPGIEIDISVLAERKARSIDIEKLIRNSEKTLVRSIKLIDMFEHESLGLGKKSLTYRVLLQSDEKTLTDEEMGQVQKKIFDELKRNNYQIRGLEA